MNDLGPRTEPRVNNFITADVSEPTLTTWDLSSNETRSRIGRVTALFCSSGRMPCSNDALHIRAITGAIALSTFLISHVGTGSRLQCFAGAFLRRSVTSSTVTGSNATSGSCTERWELSGGGALAVDDQMFSTFLAKNAANSSAEWLLTVGRAYNVTVTSGAWRSSSRRSVSL